MMVRRNAAVLRCRRKGAAAVEFALCLPILLAFVFGILEFSRLTQLKQSVRLAAFEGARAGVSLNASSSDVTTAASRIMTVAGISNYTTTITPNPLSYTSATVSVTVSLDANQNAWFKWFVRTSKTVSANVTLRREVQAISVP